MEKFIIEGGVSLKGEVEISGAKNVALPLLACSILLKEPIMFHRVPQVADVSTMLKLLNLLGVKSEKLGTNTVKLHAEYITNHRAPYELVKKMRASIYVLGPLLAREGEAQVSLPGGCAFGPRPINFHLEGLKKFGANLAIKHGYIIGKAPKLSGCEFVFPQKSVGGTIQLMMTAILAGGKTTLVNAALEPDVVAVANFLNQAGAKIYGSGTDKIEITGTGELTSPKEYEVIPDRIETGTLAVAGFMTGGKIKIKNCIPAHLAIVLAKLKESGAQITLKENEIEVKREERVRPLEITSFPYPGFPTDMQAPFMAMLTLASGISIIKEEIYPDRFIHAFELMRLGADIKVEENTAIIKGVPFLTGTQVMASDIRAGAALVLAGLVAKNTTVVDRIYHLDRGYEKLEEKLTLLGAKIRRTR